MEADVSAVVPPAPYMPPPGWPGLVTVTATVAGVAMADAGIAVVSWFAVMKVVVCFAPFQLMDASEAKLLPLTVNMNPGPLKSGIRHKLHNNGNSSWLRLGSLGSAV